LPGGSVPEIVQPGVSGAISTTAEGMANAARNTTYSPRAVRSWVEQRFSVDIMVQRYAALYERILCNSLASGVQLDHTGEVAA
jgi:hypothetical protein